MLNSFQNVWEIIAVINWLLLWKDTTSVLCFHSLFTDPQCITPLYPLLLAQISPRSEAGNNWGLVRDSAHLAWGDCHFNGGNLCPVFQGRLLCQVSSREQLPQVMHQDEYLKPTQGAGFQDPKETFRFESYSAADCCKFDRWWPWSLTCCRSKWTWTVWPHCWLHQKWEIKSCWRWRHESTSLLFDLLNDVLSASDTRAAEPGNVAPVLMGDSPTHHHGHTPTDDDEVHTSPSHMDRDTHTQPLQLDRNTHTQPLHMDRDTRMRSFQGRDTSSMAGMPATSCCCFG